MNPLRYQALRGFFLSEKIFFKYPFIFSVFITYTVQDIEKRKRRTAARYDCRNGRQCEKSRRNEAIVSLTDKLRLSHQVLGEKITLTVL